MPLEIVTTDSRVEIEASLTMDQQQQQQLQDAIRYGVIATNTSEETAETVQDELPEQEALPEPSLVSATPSLITAPSAASSSKKKRKATSSKTSKSKKSKLVGPLPPPPIKSYSSTERAAMHMARNPCRFFWAAMLVSIVLALVGLLAGDFEIAIDNAGWQSRGTLIADRHSQFIVTFLNRRDLWGDDTGEVWEDLLNNVQPGWETSGSSTTVSRRRLEANEQDDATEHKIRSDMRKELPVPITPDFQRKLRDLQETSVLSGCDTSWYSEDMVERRHVWPVWKVKDSPQPNVLLSDNAFYDLCISEEKTQQVLINKGLCQGCDSPDKCLPPYSIVFFARVTINSGLFMDCQELAAAWTQYNIDNKDLFQREMSQCFEDMDNYYQPLRDGTNLPISCPNSFSASLLDGNYGNTLRVAYTSSIFATKTTKYAYIEELYDTVPDFSKGENGYIEGTYDTQYENFVNIAIDYGFLSDMAMAAGSAAVAMLAMLVHTRSPLLTAVGLIQIMLSIPLAYFVYFFMIGLDFFPFLNFIGVFVVFALGADDIFVAVDKWKNARLEHGNDLSTPEIAAIALPDAAGAMFLTTFTTAVAFFATSITPVAPIFCFAIYCGLLIVMDYMLCVVLVFPALCIYDRHRHRSSCFLRCCHPSIEEQVEDSDEHPSFIRRVLTAFYNLIHATRYVLVVACLAAVVVSAIFAAKLELPRSADVRLLRPNNEFEMNYEWRKNLLFDQLVEEAGSSTFVMWGASPADTGDHSNPDSFTQLVLDESFEPSNWEAQLYLRDFCEKLYENEWARTFDSEPCPINVFDLWLKEQAVTEWDKQDPNYRRYCGGSHGLPVAEDLFDDCIYHWGQEERERYILAQNGKVRLMFFRFRSRVRFDSPYEETDKEWNMIEDWFKEQRSMAPEGVNKMYFTSQDYWWYDTNGQMLSTAYAASAIALATAAVVILFSSRSFVLTAFSTYTIAYVLVSVTAVLVALGWTLGFLEAICFAILIGISCDFVIHFSHAYASLPGKVDRHIRTKHAVIRMGPSILAAAFTTIAAAIIMLFTVISFFVKFAVILLATIIQATLGSFIVFVALADTFGPSDPTYLVDQLVAKWTGKDVKEEEEPVPKKTMGEEDLEICQQQSGDTDNMSAFNHERVII